jgi:vesicular inhibitory amino acid transporter
VKKSALGGKREKMSAVNVFSDVRWSRSGVERERARKSAMTFRGCDADVLITAKRKKRRGVSLSSSEKESNTLEVVGEEQSDNSTVSANTKTTTEELLSKEDRTFSTCPESCDANVILLENELPTAAKRLEFKNGDLDDGVYHPVGNSTTEQALANSVNILLGVGTLSVPYALKESGWTGLLVLLLLGATTNYTGKTLIRCQRRGSLPMRTNFNTYSDVNEDGAVQVVKKARRALTTYEDIGEAAFGEFGRSLISWVLYAELIGTCGLFFILEGDHLKLLFESTMQSKETLMLLAAGIMIPTTWLVDLSKLSLIGALGFVASVGLTGVVGFDLVKALTNPSGYEFPHTALVHYSTYPLSFGLLAFVFAGHAVFPAIYTSMQKPEEYESMLDKTYGVVMTNCLLLGCAGYFLFGDKVSSEVTLDLPAGIISTIALGLITINPFAKFALTMDPVARGVEEKFDLDTSKEENLLPARAARTGLGLFALFLAVELPYFGVAMSLVGAVLTLSVSLIFPTACYLKMFGDELDVKEKWLNYAIVGLGFLCVGSGTYSAVSALMDASSDFGM